MSLKCQNCGHERRPHTIGLPENQDPKETLPGYKISLSVCIQSYEFNPDPRLERIIELRKERHLRH